MIIDREQTVTKAVLAALAATPDERLRSVTSAMVHHLHAFIRETRPTQREVEHGIDFLIGLGQATTRYHNEAVLFADVTGVSTLVALLNDVEVGEEPATALLGPFWRDLSPETENGGTLVRSQTDGPALEVYGTVQDVEGRPVGGARVDVWHASPVGFYDNQDPSQADMNLRGSFTTDEQGRFWFTTVLPKGYPVPTHGPVGALLKAQNRHPYRPAHLHFLICKPDYKTLISQIFVADDPCLDSDVVFGVTTGLVGRFHRDNDAEPSAYRLDQDFVLKAGEALLPKPPIG